MGNLSVKMLDWEQLKPEGIEYYEYSVKLLLTEQIEKDRICIFHIARDSEFSTWAPAEKYDYHQSYAKYLSGKTHVDRAGFRLMSAPPYSLLLSWCKEVITFPFVLQADEDKFVLLRVQNLDTSPR